MKQTTTPPLPFSRTYLETACHTMPYRVGAAMKAAAATLPIDFPENCMLPTVGNVSTEDFVGYSYGGGLFFDGGAYERLFAAYPHCADDLAAIRGQMEGELTGNRYHSAIAPADLHLANTRTCWGGSWIGHCNISFGKLARLGTEGIRREIEANRGRHPEADEFYTACTFAMDMLDILGDRIACMAEENAAAEPDSAKKAEWSRIARTFRRVPRQPAVDFYEGVQVYWMLYTADGVDSPGRFDQEMFDLYEKSPEDERNAMLRRFLEGMHNVRGWNLCISGSDEQGNDQTNALSYDILALVTEMGYQTPNLTMRVHRNTPERLWQMAADCMATGIGLPALYNDEVVCAALENIGIPPTDSHDYCMNGCNQIDIMGKSHMGLEDGEVNLGRALELTLHNGYDARNGGNAPITAQFGDPRLCATFDDFLALYYKQLDGITEAAVRMANAAQETYARHAPSPLRSCFVEGCLEKGRDYKNGGPRYGHGQILMEGIADAVDSLHAVRRLIYEEKKYTMAELIDALAADFAGYERLHRDFAHCDKFGNDLPEVDELAAMITNHVFAFLKTRETCRGGVYTGGCSPFSRAADNGMATGALPNGKRSGEATYADSIAATPGRDVNGPTASLRSMLTYHQKEAGSGFVAQMKFQRALFDTEKGKTAFITLAKAYFAGGGQQLSVNVLDREALLEAQKHPENYGNLIVRVGGYSDYFRNLSPALQQNVIDRSAFEV